MFNSMDVNKAITDLLAERELKATAEIEAHNRIIVIDRTVKKLERAKLNIEHILNGKEEINENTVIAPAVAESIQSRSKE